MNSRHLKQASIPLLTVLAIWWWSGDDAPIHDTPNLQNQAAQQTQTATPKPSRLPGYYAENRQAVWADSPNRTTTQPRAHDPDQRYWAPGQTHLGPYRFRPLSEREKRRLYGAAPAYSKPGLRDFRPESYARAVVPNPARQTPRHYAPRWSQPHNRDNYSYRPTDPNRNQDRRWRSEPDQSTSWSNPYQQDPEPWSDPDYRWTAEYPSWQSPAERMLPAMEIGLDPTLSALY